MIYDNFRKDCPHIEKVFFAYLNVYSICVPSFKSTNICSLSRKRYDEGNFTPTLHQLSGVQNTSVVIYLIELTEPSDTFNYIPFFKYFTLHFLNYFTHIFIVYNYVEQNLLF